MTDEEKKAIGQCRLLLNGDITLHIIDDDGGTAYCGIVNKEYNKDLETVLNLIEKQQKEIEELKDESKEYQIGFAQGCYEKDLDWKDKIKAKIEEYMHKDFIKMQVVMSHDKEALKIAEVLQSLLEKE